MTASVARANDGTGHGGNSSRATRSARCRPGTIRFTRRTLGAEGMGNPFVVMSLVVVCSALFAWLASQSRQPILLGYFLCGILLGPAGFRLVPADSFLHDLSQMGVVLLLFLAGLVLHPDRLYTFFRKAAIVTLAGAALAWGLVFALLRAWGQSLQDSIVAGIALMFSSTILVVKLLPTTTLHQKRMGSICIAILIAQDLIAVTVLLFMGPQAGDSHIALVWLPAKVLLLTGLAILGEQHVLRRMMRRADRYNEVLIMLCLGWCVGLAALGSLVGIPSEVGAFIAGVALARGKITLILSEELKPLRDFFLMFFFFVMGTEIDVLHVGSIWIPALVTATMIAISRPLWTTWLFRRLGEEKDFARETGLRLGQASEFALVIAATALANGHLSESAAQLVQLATVASMLISSYIVIFRCPTPLGVRPGLQRD